MTLGVCFLATPFPFLQDAKVVLEAMFALLREKFAAGSDAQKEKKEADKQGCREIEKKSLGNNTHSDIFQLTTQQQNAEAEVEAEPTVSTGEFYWNGTPRECTRALALCDCVLWVWQ